MVCSQKVKLCSSGGSHAAILTRRNPLLAEQLFGVLQKKNSPNHEPRLELLSSEEFWEGGGSSNALAKDAVVFPERIFHAEFHSPVRLSLCFSVDGGLDNNDGNDDNINNTRKLVWESSQLPRDSNQTGTRAGRCCFGEPCSFLYIARKDEFSRKRFVTCLVSYERFDPHNPH